MSYRLLEGDNDWAYGECERCGMEWKFHQRYLSRETYSKELCPDCRIKPVKACGPANDYCTPWTGDVDLDTMQPLKDDGTPHLPGIRTCGNRDCVRPKHLISNDYAKSVLRRLGLAIPSTLL